MNKIVIGSLVKIVSTDEELIKQGITPKSFNKRYPERFAIVDRIYNRSLLSNEIKCCKLHKGFYITEEQLEATGTVVYRGDKAIGELLDSILKEMEKT